MNPTNGPNGPARPNGRMQPAVLAPIFIGLASIAIAFVAASSALSPVWAAALTGASAAVFVAASLLAGRRGFAETEEREQLIVAEKITETGFTDIDDKLIALDEANEFFGTSLNAADMFRLVASRVNEIYPFAAAVLIVHGEAGDVIRCVHADGQNAEALRDVEIRPGAGTAGAAFTSREIQIANGLDVDRKLLGDDRLKGFAASIAIPLVHQDDSFAVFQLFTDAAVKTDEDTRKLFEAISEHVTPIFRGSLAFERSLSSALTDALTGLPNERAFYMVLENQLAESVRNREERPLSILSIDIRDFGAVNSMLGHAVGDRLLEFAGVHIGEHLRRMDFLARTVNDEFCIVLPTATEQTALEIIERIKASFSQNEFEISDGDGVSVALNFGWATFWKDGETAEQLIRAAHQRKRQAKSEEPSVIWFPREYVN